jgi:hypothetical protein
MATNREIKNALYELVARITRKSWVSRGDHFLAGAAAGLPLKAKGSTKVSSERTGAKECQRR